MTFVSGSTYLNVQGLGTLTALGDRSFGNQTGCTGTVVPSFPEPGSGWDSRIQEMGLKTDSGMKRLLNQD